MTQIKKYSRFGNRYIIQNIVFFIPLVLLFVVLWMRWEKMDFVFWSCLILFCVGVIGGVLWDRYRLKTFRCPECGKAILNPTIVVRAEGDPINYYCPDCDVEWETTLFESHID